MASYWEIAAHSAYDMLSKYKVPNCQFSFSHLGFWSRNLFLIAPFPDLCLLVPFSKYKVPNCQFSFSHLGFWSGNFLLITPFPDHCLLVPF